MLLTDDPQGRFVDHGGARPRRRTGENVQEASAKLTASKRFCIYIVKCQHGLASGVSGVSSWAGADGTQADVKTVGGTTVVTPTQGAAGAPKGGVQRQMRAVAHEQGVPRHRPRVVLAESPVDLAADAACG